MKIQHIMLLSFLTSCYTVSAQTTNTLTPTNTPSQLTIEQATSLAIRLANDRCKQDYPGNVHPTIFEKYKDPKSNAAFIDGHWIWTGNCLIDPLYWYSARVELASDGSPNSVEVKLCHSPSPPWCRLISRRSQPPPVEPDSINHFVQRIFNDSFCARRF